MSTVMLASSFTSLHGLHSRASRTGYSGRTVPFDSARRAALVDAGPTGRAWDDRERGAVELSSGFAELAQWLARPLRPGYAVVEFGPLRLPTRTGLTPESRTIWVAVGAATNGRKNVLGVWLAEDAAQQPAERAFAELRQRGVLEIGIVITDLQRAVPDAIATSFPAAQIQTCIPRLALHSLRRVPTHERRRLSRVLAPIYGASTRGASAAALAAAECSEVGLEYPAALAPWRRHWQYVTPAMSFPLKHRRLLQSTTALDELRSALRGVTTGRGGYFSEMAALGTLYRTLRETAAGWQAARAEPLEPPIAPLWEVAIPAHPRLEAIMA